MVEHPPGPWIAKQGWEVNGDPDWAKNLRGTHDCVILDAPPLLPVADASGLAPQVDGVLLSVRHGVTHKEQLRQAADALRRVNAQLLGIVLNIVSPKAALATDRGYGYGYEEGNGKHAEP